MKGHRTTYVSLFDAPEDGRPAVTSIEIPIIQRDFAQGRRDDETTGIRERFLDALVRAATTDVEMPLDFIYGDVKAGVLRPLDGQQRLTTLFLLHWYVSSRCGALDPAAPWLKFTYRTRPGARDFCQTLANHPYLTGHLPPSKWITDQHWYAYPWRQDPTISSMLVMLDDIHQRFDRETDFDAVWARLENREKPGIWFLFLPVADMDYGEDLYIKMNSRGKPLTPFEVFKADLEGILKPSLSHEQHEHLKVSIDGSWTDLLWDYEKSSGSDFVIDDEFMRYLSFIIDVSEWRDGQPNRRWRDNARSREWPLEERARLAFADPNNAHSARNREFFFHAFDTWDGVSPAAELSKLFSAGGTGQGPLPLLVSASPDLFGACITNYGRSAFSLAETLLLFAVLLARLEPIPTPAEVTRRLRSLRNLAESAFLDRRRMTEYISATERLMRHGTLDGAQGFNAEWTADERLKWTFCDENPGVTDSVYLLEDLPVLRGRLFAFELQADTIVGRATAFAAVADPGLRDAFGAALLTKGDYSRDVGWDGRRRQLGSLAKDDSWRDLFTTGSRASVARTREPLMALLDDIHEWTASADEVPTVALEAIREEWLRDREMRHHLDWRYYLVRYPGARSSMGDGYFHNSGYDPARGGFSYGRIRLLYGSNYQAYFSDALLRAAWIEGNLASIAHEPKWWHRDDPGMVMKGSELEIRCVDDGLELVFPADDETTSAPALEVVRGFRTVAHNRVVIRQEDRDGVPVDVEDRIQVCIRVARALHGAGL